MTRTSKAASPIGGPTQPPAKIEVTLTVNGVEARLEVAPWTTLLDALRDHLDLTGTRRAVTMVNAAPAPSLSMIGASIPVSLSRS